ncbi:hypothetical protein BUALT_Bualt01G0220600 [Buddleja alternifolia]|uniref:Uncharacterized protein n=1 Tax=Buddleja alternifolia TaxID=168488 RepID=A0AAV6Y955_9LAMI|nr:hypothetical protein BUALT_Bualt01G0220600 [Buddleja alternifolia]
MYLPCQFKLYAHVSEQNLRPASNSITYWTDFVEKYYDSSVVEKWCYGSCNNLEVLGIRKRMYADSLIAQHCRICGLTSKGHYKANKEFLPLVFKFKFDNGVMKEKLDLSESAMITISPKGKIMLEYGKAVRQIIYRDFAVSQQGKLHVIFTEDMKILSWEFCAQVLHVPIPPPLPNAQPENESEREERLSRQTKQVYMEMRKVKVNYLGLPQLYSQCFQLSNNFEFMRDIMRFSIRHKLGPLESYRKYSAKSILKKALTTAMKTQDEANICILM